MDFDLPEPITRRNQGTKDPPEHLFVLPPVPDLITEEYALASSPIHLVSQDEDTSSISDSIHRTLAEVLFNVWKSIAVPIHLLSAPSSPTEAATKISDDTDIVEDEILVTPYDASYWKKQIREATLPLHDRPGNKEPSKKNDNPLIPEMHTSPAQISPESAVVIPPENFIIRQIFNNVCLREKYGRWTSRHKKSTSNDKPHFSKSRS
ncbi:unnamed protein product [Heligmosomoides polygyrus]|uniref:Reverse transcriptase n=1 Tax=Heligmosomoides polygyrus TaxID=6339 RepID=A0A183GEP9_HELPZ|nr:unnamed protein product [Heligmosomoides polygyrus]